MTNLMADLSDSGWTLKIMSTSIQPGLGQVLGSVCASHVKIAHETILRGPFVLGCDPRILFYAQFVWCVMLGVRIGWTGGALES
jgi:hypothetical protein